MISPGVLDFLSDSGSKISSLKLFVEASEETFFNTAGMDINSYLARMSGLQNDIFRT